MFKKSQMLKGMICLIWCVVVLFPFPSHGDMGTEINHLLEYIDASDCTFIRNGKAHDGKEAGAHIRRKYGHIKNRVKTTEDFIQYAATKSSMSGQSYQVICSGKKMATAEWLTKELERFRNREDMPQ